jgi:hypothetical protein
LLSAGLLAVPGFAQSNAVPGLDTSVHDVVGVSVYGRRGPAHPQGEVGIGIGHYMCNSGTVPIPWYGTAGGVMVDTYPKIAFLIVRESNGRMVQISQKGHLKHSRQAFNFSGGVCGTCQGGGSTVWGPGCFDVYSTGFNGDRYNLGPNDEVDPWLGTWNPQGSYFDRGDPDVGPPLNFDRVQSLSGAQINAFDAVKNRIVVRESELVAPGTFYSQVHLVVIGEPVAARGDNQVSRQTTFTWNGSLWSAANVNAPAVQGSVLARRSGAVTGSGGNGGDDGRFLVACKVTGPVAGLWHYEYAIHNLDNSRAGASLRVPVCAAARVEQAGFRDIDYDPVTDWTFHRAGGEIAWLAAAGNALEWNTIYNFWFDSDAAPVPGTVQIDQARPGPGALTVAVAIPVPGSLPHVWLGAGCGAPAPVLSGVGEPAVPNPGYGLRLQAPPSAPTFAWASWGGGQWALGAGCALFVDGAQLAAVAAGQADATGLAVWALPIPAGLPPVDIYVQAAVLDASGPLYGALALSNGMCVRVGWSGCP